MECRLLTHSEGPVSGGHAFASRGPGPELRGSRGQASAVRRFSQLLDVDDEVTPGILKVGREPGWGGEGGWGVGRWARRHCFWGETFADCVCWSLSMLVGPTGESGPFPELKRKRLVGGSLGDKGDSSRFPSPVFVVVLGWLGQAPGVNHRLFKHLALRAEGPCTEST